MERLDKGRRDIQQQNTNPSKQHLLVWRKALFFPSSPLHPNLLKQKQLVKRINDDKQKGGWKSENEWRSACGGKCSNP